MKTKPTVEQMEYLIEFLASSPRERDARIEELRGEISARIAEKFVPPERRKQVQSLILNMSHQGADFEGIARLLDAASATRDTA